MLSQILPKPLRTLRLKPFGFATNSATNHVKIDPLVSASTSLSRFIMPSCRALAYTVSTIRVSAGPITSATCAEDNPFSLSCVPKADKLLELSGAIAGVFSRFSHGASKKQISAGIRSSVIKASKEIRLSNPDILPSDLKIKWAENDDIDSFFDDNCVVLRLRKSTNPNENYVNVIYHFVSAGLLRNQRHYFDDQIMKAADLLITQKIVTLAKPSANSVFYDNIYIPVIKADESLLSDYECLKSIDFNGMLFNIYLNELAKASATISGQIPDPCLIAESGELLRFLYRISTRANDETVELNLMCNYFQIGIVLAVNSKTLNQYGWAAHCNYIKRLLDKDYRTVYLLGIGSKAKIASIIAYAIKDADDRIVKSITHKYRHVNPISGKRYDAVCIELDTY